MRYLLDTNILSHLVRNPRGVVARKIALQIQKWLTEVG